MVRLQHKLDDWRVSLHFKRVEAILRNRDVSHLPPTLQQARESYVSTLHDYAARGIFPRNYEQPDYAPCFIDRDGRECAVAHLVISSGQAELANKIAAVANYAYVPEMTFPELDNWATQAGLSREEVALIQPGYWVALEGGDYGLAFAVWAIALVALLINAAYIRSKLKSRIIAILLRISSLAVIILLLLMSWICWDNYAGASAVLTDHSNYLYNQASRDAGPYALGFVISLVLALLIGGACLYGMDNRHENREPRANDVDTLADKPPNL